jgi:uncharacterized protein (DUF3820 family)
MDNAAALRALLKATMPYGKHAGTPLIDLPVSYLEWFARKGFPEGELGRKLSAVHEIKINGLERLLDPLRDGGPRGRRP